MNQKIAILLLAMLSLQLACLAGQPTIAANNTPSADADVRTKTGLQQVSADALDPQKTWLFAVGILTFSNNASWCSSNRRDSQIVSLFRRRGLPHGHIKYIADEDGTLANIKNALGPFLDRSQQGDLLIHYYTGHGGVGSFETTNDGSYSHAYIGKQIKSRFHGSQVLLLGDCCDSGSLEDVVRNAVGNPIAFACLSSSARNESGNGRWTFSQAVLDGLRGEPYVDLNHDGYITIDEIAAHVKHDILFYERNHSVYRKTPNFNGQMVVATAKATNTKAPEPVQVWYQGKWWKAKLMERSGNQARIRWIQLGYDLPSQDIWVNLNNVRRLSRPN